MDDTLEVIAWIGFVVCVYYVLKWLILFLCFICHRCINIEEFNHGWAVVTGATDGIGRAFAENLARKGFKVVLISRTEEKLMTVVEEIKQTTGNQHIEYIVADFSKCHQNPEEFYGKITHQLEGKEISALVNNVGIVTDRPFTEQTPEEIET
jgi:17beta-estradiol 17-dehydrogenase / very-long-chain 3-oxoacyl-CoA reductase